MTSLQLPTPRASRALRPRQRSARRTTLFTRACRFEPLEVRILLSTATLAVNATANVHAINPLIYGASDSNPTDINTLKLTSARDGGNASDTYNWVLDATNHGSDWYYESIGNGTSNGASLDSFISDANSAGATPLMTVNILPYAAKTGAGGVYLGSYPVSVYGAQQSVDPYRTNFGNGVTTGGANILDTNPLYNYVANSPAFEQAWIQHINGAATYFIMGNEPALWNSTHRDLHPNPETNTELLTVTTNYASMIKTLNPNAKIIGPEEWGWTNYLVDGAAAAVGNWGATYGNGLNVEQWYLQQLQAYQTANGVRLLDYFSNHLYPQANGVFGGAVDQTTALLRNATTRDFWDPNYTDPSWINSKIQLIPRMQSWVNTYYPGTKTAITEYNWGADGDMNGATAQADIYGIMGAQGLDMADRWGVPSSNTPVYKAMQLWRNYDGAGSGFGETSVGDSVANPDNCDSFAAIRASDGALTVAVINKKLYSAGNPTTTVTVNLSNFSTNGAAGVWQLAATSPTNQTVAAITHLSDITVTGNSAIITVPDESVTMLVFQPNTSIPAQPSGLTATPGNTQVALQWNATGGATSYDIYRATTPGAEGSTPYKTNIATSNYTDINLTNGTPYYYQVSAVNGSGQGLSTTEVSATPHAPIPATPTGWTVTPGDTNVTLQWDVSTDATTYDIYRSTTPGGEGSTPYRTGITTTDFTDVTLPNGTTYYYQVTAVNATGQSAKTAEGSATPQIAAPATPTGLTATPTNTRVALQWNIATTATTYNLYRSSTVGGEGSTPYKTGLTTANYTDIGLTNGTPYYYQVTAVNAGGESATTAEISAMPPVPSATTATTHLVVTGPDAGDTVDGPLVKVFDATSGNLQFFFLAYDRRFLGAVRVAMGDFNGDGVPDIVTATGSGGMPLINVYDGKTGTMTGNFYAYDPGYIGGVEVAVADVTGSGHPDIITSTDARGVPLVNVFNAGGTLLLNFWAYDPNYLGGVRIASGDFTGDGKAQIVTATARGGQPLVNVFNWVGTLLCNSWGDDPGYTGGIQIAVGNFTNDNVAKVATYRDQATSAQVKLYNLSTQLQFNTLTLADSTLPLQLRLAATDANGDNIADIITVPMSGHAPQVEIFSGADGSLISKWPPYTATVTTGLFVAAD